MQMARKVGVKIICRIVVTNSFFSPQTRVLVKIKPFNPTSPIFNLSHSFPSLTPTHCIHIVNVDISETKWSASKVWGGRHSLSVPASPHLSRPSPVSHPQSPSHPRAQHTSASAPGLKLRLNLRLSRTKVSIYNLSLIRGRGRHHQWRKYEESTTYIGESVLDFDH